MKLYEVLNENYDGKVIKFLEHGKNVYFKIKKVGNQYGFVQFVNNEEGILLNPLPDTVIKEIKLVETKEEKYNKLSEEEVKLKFWNGFIKISPIYMDYKKALESEKNIRMEVKIGTTHISVLLSISECDVMMKFVDEIKECLGK